MQFNYSENTFVCSSSVSFVVMEIKFVQFWQQKKLFYLNDMNNDIEELNTQANIEIQNT
jgi:hypothetical protein